VVVLDLEGVEEGVAELFFGEVFNHLRIMVTEGRCPPIILYRNELQEDNKGNGLPRLQAG
jgi:hypothetical protein